MGCFNSKEIGKSDHNHPPPTPPFDNFYDSDERKYTNRFDYLTDKIEDARRRFKEKKLDISDERKPLTLWYYDSNSDSYVTFP